MIIEILISVVLLFVGIVVLVVIHVCIAGRPFRESESDGGGGGEKSKTTPFEDLKKKLPCYEYKAEDKGSSSSSPVDCVVCLENFMVGEKCRLLPNCSHSFHVECIDSWLLKTPVCPICRTRVCSSEICPKEEVSVGSGNVGTESI